MRCIVIGFCSSKSSLIVFLMIVSTVLRKTVYILKDKWLTNLSINERLNIMISDYLQIERTSGVVFYIIPSLVNQNDVLRYIVIISIPTNLIIWHDFCCTILYYELHPTDKFFSQYIYRHVLKGFSVSLILTIIKYIDKN